MLCFIKRSSFLKFTPCAELVKLDPGAKIKNVFQPNVKVYYVVIYALNCSTALIILRDHTPKFWSKLRRSKRCEI